MEKKVLQKMKIIHVVFLTYKLIDLVWVRMNWIQAGNFLFIRILAYLLINI